MTKTFTFNALPKTVDEFLALPEASLDSPFKTAALTMIALVVYEKDANLAIDMINALRGPAKLSNYDIQFLRDRLRGKEYKGRSFFKGTSPKNNYTPTMPYTIDINDNIYSYQEENYATMHVVSSGADNPRSLKFRLKPSTNQWFLIAIECLTDIRIPVEQDEWA